MEKWQASGIGCLLLAQTLWLSCIAAMFLVLLEKWLPRQRKRTGNLNASHGHSN